MSGIADGLAHARALVRDSTTATTVQDSRAVDEVPEALLLAPTVSSTPDTDHDAARVGQVSRTAAAVSVLADVVERLVDEVRRLQAGEADLRVRHSDVVGSLQRLQSQQSDLYDEVVPELQHQLWAIRALIVLGAGQLAATGLVLLTLGLLWVTR